MLLANTTLMFFFQNEMHRNYNSASVPQGPFEKHLTLYDLQCSQMANILEIVELKQVFTTVNSTVPCLSSADEEMQRATDRQAGDELMKKKKMHVIY